MRRRSFLYAFGALPFAAATAIAQQRRKPVIGFLYPADNTTAGQFLVGLRDLGYVDGQNIILESRAAVRSDQFASLAAELVAIRVDVLVVGGSQATAAAQQATITIPIVMTGTADPLGNNFVASLARPGGNITGMSLFNTEVSGKRLQLLKEATPGLSTIGILANRVDPSTLITLRETRAAAAALGLTTVLAEVQGPEDFDAAFAELEKSRPKGLVPLSSSIMVPSGEKIAALAIRYGMASIYPSRGFAERGGLMSYGPNPAGLARRSAVFVDKILKGAAPADLPVEQPTRFEMVINLKTAKALGIEIPPMMLALADEVIE